MTTKQKKTKVVRKVSRKKTQASNSVVENTAAAATAAPAPAAAATTTVTTAATTASEVSWKSSYDRVLELQATLVSTMKQLNTEVKTLKKHFEKELKSSKKKRKSSGVKRAPSGFAKPTLISVELCDFLGKPKGTEMARTEVTKLLTQYVREHNLQDPNNKRTIVPDARLQKLLNVTNNDTVTYFNLQKHMKPHFPKRPTTA